MNTVLSKLDFQKSAWDIDGRDMSLLLDTSSLSPSLKIQISCVQWICVYFSCRGHVDYSLTKVVHVGF